MITKNGSILWGKGRLGNTTIDDDEMKTFQGTDMGMVVDGAKGNINLSSTNPQYYSLAIGEGTNEPQKGDYNIQEITSSRVQKSAITSVSYTPDGNPVLTRTFTSISSENVTITEFGIYLVVQGYVFLVARKLIPPRTLAPGETATFSYEIAFN